MIIFRPACPLGVDVHDAVTRLYAGRPEFVYRNNIRIFFFLSGVHRAFCPILADIPEVSSEVIIVCYIVSQKCFRLWWLPMS